MLRIIIKQKKDTELETVFKVLYDIASIPKGSWRIKYQIAEMFPSFCEIMSPDQVQDKVLPILEKLIVDAEAEVRSEALHTMISVGRKCDS